MRDKLNLILSLSLLFLLPLYVLRDRKRRPPKQTQRPLVSTYGLKEGEKGRIAHQRPPLGPVSPDLFRGSFVSSTADPSRAQRSSLILCYCAMCFALASAAALALCPSQTRISL